MKTLFFLIVAYLLVRLASRNQTIPEIPKRKKNIDLPKTSTLNNSSNVNKKFERKELKSSDSSIRSKKSKIDRFKRSKKIKNNFIFLELINRKYF